MAQNEIVPSTRLNSWKEIATFLGRGVRTVQRWERDLQLPVHRIGKGKRSPVYALVSEVNFWIATSGITPPRPQLVPQRALRSGNGTIIKSGSPIDVSHHLMAESLKLIRLVAETSVRQRRQAELLRKHI